MNVTKKAIQNLHNKQLQKEHQRHKDLEILNKNEEFLKLNLERKTLIIEKSKAEFLNQPFDEKKLTECENKLSKLIVKTFKNYNDNPLSIFSLAINCPYCNDKHFLDGKPCICLNSEKSKILKEESGLKNFAKFSQSDFSKFGDSQKIEKVYSSLEKWCDKPFESKITNCGFFGHTGNGKTFLMQCMADKLIENGYMVYFTTAFNFLEKIIKSSTDETNENLEEFLTCDILFIDDLGTEKFFKNQNEIFLFNVINQRVVSNKPIIFSTNLDMNDFFERYGERIFSRLVDKQKSKVFWFEDADLRIKK